MLSYNFEYDMYILLSYKQQNNFNVQVYVHHPLATPSNGNKTQTTYIKLLEILSTPCVMIAHPALEALWFHSDVCGSSHG